MIPQEEDGPADLYCKATVFRDWSEDYTRRVVCNRELCYMYVTQAQTWNTRLKCWPLEITSVQLVDESKVQQVTTQNSNYNTEMNPCSGKICLVDVEGKFGYMTFTTPARLQGSRIKFNYDQICEELRELFNTTRGEDIEGLRVSGKLSETQTGPQDTTRTVCGLEAANR